MSGGMSGSSGVSGAGGTMFFVSRSNTHLSVHRGSTPFSSILSYLMSSDFPSSA